MLGFKLATGVHVTLASPCQVNATNLKIPGYRWWLHARLKVPIMTIRAICPPEKKNEGNIWFYSLYWCPADEQRNKSLRFKRELHWIKTLGTQFPHGMNQKIMRKRDIFIIFPFSYNARKAFKITKDIYTKLQKMYPNVFKGELMCPFKRTKIWVITLFLLN